MKGRFPIVPRKGHRWFRLHLLARGEPCISPLHEWRKPDVKERKTAWESNQFMSGANGKA